MNKYLYIILCLILCSTQSFASAGERVSIATIFSSELEPYKQALDGLKNYFSEKNVSLELTLYSLKKKKPDLVIQQISQEKPDVVYSIGTNALRFAQQRIIDTPVVFSMVLNPGKITKTNITGVSLNIPVKVKLRNIKQILPFVKRIGMIYSPKFLHLYMDASKACSEMGFQLVSKLINSKSEIAGAIKEISKQIDCFLVIPDTEIYIPQLISNLILEGLRSNFPVIGLSVFHTKAGALLSFEGDYHDIGSQAGEIALEIHNGEQSVYSQLVKPRKTRFSLNLLVAERLNISLPSKVIKEASEVFGK